MAGVFYYNTGTATVAVNSKTVTGTGTNWLSVVGGLTAIKAGDKFGIHVGRPIIIASVDSNTQLTLEDNWPGPAQTNAAYKIELTSPDVIAVEALRRVLGSLSGGILYGVSQLTAAPNKALTIDETGAVALADLSTFGKSLIAVLNSSAAYGVLGEIPNGQLPARLRALPTFVNDWNNVRENGFYFGGPESANTPAQPWSFVGVVKAQSSSYCVQTLTALGVSDPANNVTFERQIVNNVPSAWFRVHYTEAELDARYMRPSQAISNAQLPGRLRQDGQVITDWNNAIQSGFYFGESAANSPPGIDGGLIGYVAAASGDGAVVQTVVRWWGISPTASVTWRRAKQGPNAWTAWDLQITSVGELDARYNRLSQVISNSQLPGTQTYKLFSGTGLLGGIGIRNTTPTTANRDYRILQKDNGNLEITDETAGLSRMAISPTGATAFNGASLSHNGNQVRTAADAYAKSETYTQAQTQSLVTTARQVRLAGLGEIAATTFQWNEAAAGCVFTGVFLDGNWGIRNYRYRAIQQTDLSGNWVTVAQA
jgi:hypothetical protein